MQGIAVGLVLAGLGGVRQRLALPSQAASCSGPIPPVQRSTPRLRNRRIPVHYEARLPIQVGMSQHRGVHLLSQGSACAHELLGHLR